MTANIFAELPVRIPDELVTTLLEAADVRIEWIVSHGHTSADGFWYDQDQHEWVIVLKGAAISLLHGVEERIHFWTGQ